MKYVGSRVAAAGAAADQEHQYVRHQKATMYNYVRRQQGR